MSDWNQKQVVSIRIVAQLKSMTDEERKAFILKLLDHLDPVFVQALDFAYGIIPEPEPEPDVSPMSDALAQQRLIMFGTIPGEKK